MQDQCQLHLLHNNEEHPASLVLLNNQVKSCGSYVLHIRGPSSEDWWRQVYGLHQKPVSLWRPARQCNSCIQASCSMHTATACKALEMALRSAEAEEHKLQTASNGLQFESLKAFLDHFMNICNAFQLVFTSLMQSEKSQQAQGSHKQHICCKA